MATSSQHTHENASDSGVAERDGALLQEAVQRLALQAVRLYRWRSGLWWLALALVATMALVAGDYLMHVEEAGLRWLLSLCWLVALAMGAWRWLPPAWRFSLSPVRVAQWIESSRPELGDRLSTTLAIAELPDSDLRYGSQKFRQAALHATEVESLRIDWRSYLDWRPTLRALAGVLALGLIAAALTVVFPQVVGRGLARLVGPWNNLPWPHADDLRFVNLPSMIASGSELSIEVIDSRPPLPAALELQILAASPDQPTGPKRLMRLPMRVLEKVALATVADMRSNFSVRVVGGDDQDSLWNEVRVAELPELLEQQFHVSPPPYSRQPTAELVGERIEVLAGSKVVFHGRYSSRMRNIVAQSAASPQASSGTSLGPAVQEPAVDAGTDDRKSAQTSWPAILSADHQAFDLFLGDGGGLVVDGDRRWQLHLETEDGLELVENKTWSIHVVADRAPTVNLLPLEPSLVTRDSVVEILGQASDDLELVEVQLVWQSEEAGEPRKQTLWQPASGSSGAGEAPGTVGTESSATAPQQALVHRQANIHFQWRPGEQNFPLGQPVTVYLEARDSLGQVTRSVSQTLQIQDPQTVLAHLQAEQAKTFEPLRQLLAAQRRNEQAVKRTRDIVQETQTFTPEQNDALSTARQLQQSIAQQLAHSPSSILDKLKALGAQLERTALDETDLAKQVERLAREIERMDAESIEPALQALDAAQAAMRTALDESASEADKSAAATRLETTAASQEQAAAQLSRLVESIAAAETMASVQRQFDDLERRQNELRAATERFQVERVARPESKDAEATRIGLRSDQLSLARDVDDLVESIDEKLQRAGQTEEPSQTALEKARQALVEQQVSQTMREAAERVDAEQLSDGIKAQRAAATAIARASTHFGGGGTTTLESSSANLQAVAEQLGGLADREGQVAEAMQNPAAAQSAPELAKQQEELADSAAALAAELEQQSNHSLSETVGKAQERAAEAARQAGQADMASAAHSAREAAEQFREAQRSAQQRVLELENQLVTQQLLDLGAAVEDLVRRQAPIVDNLMLLEQTAANMAELPGDWAAQLRDAAAAEEGVRQRLLETSGRMQDLDTFAWLLEQCEIDMARAVAALERQQLKPDAVTSAASALRKLKAAAQALVPPEAGPDESAHENDNQQADDAQAAQERDPQAEQRRPSLASLKLLRALQSAITEETKALQANGKDDQGSEMLRLADEQQALAEQTQKLMQDIMK